MPNKYLDSVGLAEYTTLIKTALDDKADLDSPALTGTPTAPTPTAGDDSTKVATTAFVNTKAGNYLPLAGGTMTGMLKTSSEIRFYTDSGRLSLNGGNTGGAYLNMYGKNHGTWPGLFSLTATDGTNNFSLQGASDGTLKWRSYDIALAKDVLSLSGGTMTGNIILNKEEGRITLSTAQNEEGRLRLLGGSGISNGAQLLLSGKSNSSTAGQFQLGANDGTNSTSLLGKPDGTLTWGGKTVIVGTEASESHTISTINSGAQTSFTVSNTPRYYSVSMSGTGFASMLVTKGGANTFYVVNTGSVNRTNITVTVKYIY